MFFPARTLRQDAPGRTLFHASAMGSGTPPDHQPPRPAMPPEGRARSEIASLIHSRPRDRERALCRARGWTCGRLLPMRTAPGAPAHKPHSSEARANAPSRRSCFSEIPRTNAAAERADAGHRHSDGHLRMSSGDNPDPGHGVWNAPGSSAAWLAMPPEGRARSEIASLIHSRPRDRVLERALCRPRGCAVQLWKPGSASGAARVDDRLREVVDKVEAIATRNR
jgi:hypothetical protein